MISILQAIELIRGSYSVESGIVPFSIEYFKGDGTVGYKDEVIVYKKALSRKQTATEESKFKYSLMDSGMLLLYDLTTEKPFSKEFFLLKKINGQLIHHE